MNKKIKLITVLSAAALGMALVSCSGNAGDVSSSESSGSDEQAVAQRIKHDDLPYVVVGEELDLDEYITVSYSDGSSDKTYDVSCTNKAVAIQGHKVTVTEGGSYTLVITAGSVTVKIELSAVTEEHKGLIDYLQPLEENPQNYTLQLLEMDTQGNLLYGGVSYFHNENYIAIFDESDPASKTDDGEANSTLLAKLADGHAYWGSVGGTSDDPKAVFEPGYASYGNYYITMDLTLDATDFTVDDSKEIFTSDVLKSSYAFEESLMSYGCSQTTSYINQRGYDWDGAYYMGQVENNAGEESALFFCTIKDTKTGKVGLFGIFTLKDIGTTDVDFMTDIATNMAYVPTKVKGDEITTAFSNLAEGKNFTLTTELFSADDDGNMLTYGTEIGEDALIAMTGHSHIIYTSTYTEDGVIAVAEANTYSVNEAQNAFIGNDDMGVVGKYALWDDGEKTYSSELSIDTDGNGTMSAPKEIASTKVYETTQMQKLSPANVTEADANGTIWAKKTTEGTKTTFTGQVGDNDGTEVTNSLFQKIFDLNGFIINQGQTLGTFLASAAEFTGGDQHALTLYSNYSYFTVDSATNEVSVFINAYLPVGLDNNVGIKLTISNVGTTTNDFSTFSASK